MSDPAEIVFLVREANPNAYQIEGYDSAIIGFTYGWDDTGPSQGPVFVYSVDKLRSVFSERNPTLADEDAIEHIEFNLIGYYHGPGTPVFVFTEHD